MPAIPMRRAALRLALALVFVPTLAAAQALPSLSLLRVRFNTARTNAKPDGDLKIQIDAIDRELAEAARLGRTGDQRRLLAKGLTLLDGRPWTDADDYRNSLVIRADRVFADSTKPFGVRLEQIYAPAIELSPALTATVQVLPIANAAAEPMTLASFQTVPRDLRESPLAMDLDLSKVPDGTWALSVEMADGARTLGRTQMRMAVQRGLDGRLAALDSAAGSVPEAVRADIRYPMDVIRKVNRGLMEIGTFDPAREIASAEAIAESARGGRNPFAGRTGDFERHYLFESAGEIMPYRVYVPTTYDARTPTPLVIALHGLGATEDSFFDSYARLPPKLAEQHGFLLAAPLGFRVDGFYGSRIVAANDPAAARRADLSEQDVMNVLARMRADYNVDADRIYLIGHSMGAIGTWALGAKYPDVWAALGPFSGIGMPATAARVQHIPQIVVHGDADPTVNVAGSRTMVEALKKLGVEVTYIEVAGGNHIDVVVPNLPRVFEFLAAKRRAPRSTQQ
jgi:poly(3-hydroxybutyrate) depolymerase